MSASEINPVDETDPVAGAPDAPTAGLYGEVIALARRTAAPGPYLVKVLRHLAGALKSPYAALHIRFASEVVQDDWHVGRDDPGFWKPALQGFLTDSVGLRHARAQVLRARSGTGKAAFISVPVFDDQGSTIGAMAFVLAPLDEAALPQRLAMVDAAVRLAGSCVNMLGDSAVAREAHWRGGGPADGGEAGGGRAGRMASGRGAGDCGRGGVGARGGRSFSAMARAAASSSLEELAFSLVNELCSKLDCEQVVLGMVRGRRHVRVTAISGLDQINRRSPGVIAATAAMEECLDAGRPIGFHREEGWSHLDAVAPACVYRLHKRWHAATNGDAVASIPLYVDDVPVAILGVRSRADRPLSAEQLTEVRSKVEPYAPALLLAERAGRSLAAHTKEVVCGSVAFVRAPGSVGRKVAAAAVGVAAALFVFGSIPYRVSAPCVVQAAEVRYVAAPQDAVLAEAFVVAGDRVEAGQVLCRFDGRELTQEAARLEAELSVLAHERDAALAGDEPVAAKLAAAKQELVLARLAMARLRLDQLTVRAPFDGVVLSGDLRKRIGSVIPRGEPLFRLAPSGQWRVELELPQDVLADVGAGARGSFVSFARPDQPCVMDLVRAPSASQVREGRTVFVAEGALGRPPAWIRAGMEGVARIDAGRRRVWWVALHGIIDYARLHFWL